MGWLDRQAKVLLASVVVLQLAIIVVSLFIQQGLNDEAIDGYVGVSYAIYGAWALVVFGLLIPLAAFGFAIPLIALDVFGVVASAAASAYPLYGSDLWLWIVVLYAVSAAVAIYLQMLRIVRWQESRTQT